MPYPSALDRLAQLARETPLAPALVSDAYTFSYQQLQQKVLMVAANLRALGLQPGERVAICLPNSEAYIVLLLAILRSGVVAVPISTRFPHSQAEHMLNNIGVGKLIFDNTPNENWSLKAFAVNEIFAEIGDGELKTALPAFDPASDATVLFTSGSSGQPKAVLHSLHSHDLSAIGSNANLSFGPEDRWLLSLPLYHVGGLGILFRAMHGGGAIVFSDNTDLAAAIASHRITHASLVATQLYRIMQKSDSLPRLKTLKAVLLGGSAIPSSLLRKATEHNLPVFTTYGSTEMASQVTTTPPDCPLEKLFTSGKPLAHRQVCISPGGEILVRGRTRFKGYLTPTGLLEPFDAEGWFATGDLGGFDADGYLHVTGRKDNMFISGGENIQPEEIEQALCQIDGVLQAVVVPVADDEFGQRPVAFVRMQAGMQIDSEAIQRCLAAKIARFKIPRHIFAWPFPETQADMKINRLEFTARAVELMGK